MSAGPSNGEEDDRHRSGEDSDRLGNGGPEQGGEESAGQTDDGPDQPDRVGYKRPPKHSQIKKGEVRNPTGRPKGSKNRPKDMVMKDFYKTILDEAGRIVPLNDGSGGMSMGQAIVRSTFVAAAKGNTRAQRHATRIIEIAETETKREREHELGTALEYKMAWTRELARRKARGIKGPAPLPHPDHVVLDLAKGVVHVKGPFTPEEKIAWARWEEFRGKLEADRAGLQAFSDDPSCADPENFAEAIDDTTFALEVIDLALDGNRHAMAVLEEAFRMRPDVILELEDDPGP